MSDIVCFASDFCSLGPTTLRIRSHPIDGIDLRYVTSLDSITEKAEYK